MSRLSCVCSSNPRYNLVLRQPGGQLSFEVRKQKINLLPSMNLKGCQQVRLDNIQYAELCTKDFETVYLAQLSPKAGIQLRHNLVLSVQLHC